MENLTENERKQIVAAWNSQACCRKSKKQLRRQKRKQRRERRDMQSFINLQAEINDIVLREEKKYD